ncbi:Sin3 associated polypeptide p18-domain-containing protein [Melampsora americana]|nr:Sin3 associated polypeptide p18-domain-containing protein [Melampsora americana]
MVERTRPRPAPVDREKTCPFLLRVFVKPGSYHDLDRDFQLPDKLPSTDESQLYAWKDTTLRDICLQIVETSPSVKLTSGAKFSIRLIFLDAPRDVSSTAVARYKSQELGTVFARDLSRDSTSGPAPGASARTLQELQFMVGDYLDIALLPTHPTPGTAFSPTESRMGFGIRGAASASARNTPNSALDGPRWGRPTSSNTWGAPSSGPPRWGNSGDRVRTSFDSGRGRSSFNGHPDRERFETRHNHGNNRRRHSRSRSPSVPRRGGGRDYSRRGGR